jgi:serine/threonine-protein kinase
MSEARRREIAALAIRSRAENGNGLMSTGASCPSRDLLRRSLDPDDSLPETERRWIEEHVDRCERGCKAVIETLLRGMTLLSGSAPTRAAAGAVPAEPPPPPSVPGYEIVGELGRGGMAIVYQARQVGLNRVVALKMVRAGAHATAEEFGRFRSEAQAVAALRHPNVVQIYEIGAHDGCPYLALEFVEGGSLAQRLARERARPRSAAELVETLARAVHFAHQQGIIHRDLKPANVLLTADGTPKVADFGLAKRLEGSLDQTRTGQILGTPNFMAPEQAGESITPVGTLADVYALGAILYSMLAGRPPFVGPTPWYVLNQVRTVEPVPPRRLVPETPADLETICLKCLQKSPERRYGSAEALADDLRRYLSGEPVRARPTKEWERAWKWIKRRPVVSGLAAALLLAIATGTVASWLLAARAERAAADARADRDRAVTARARTREALDAMVSEISGDSLTAQKALSPEQKKFLSNAVKYYEEFAAEPGEDRQGQERLAKALLSLGRIRYRLGQSEEGAQVFRRAVELYTALAADSPSVPQFRHGLAYSQNDLGLILENLGALSKAEAAHRAAIANFGTLAAELPDEVAYHQGLAESLNNLGALLNKLGKRVEAEVTYRMCVAEDEKLAVKYPAAPKYRSALAQSQNNLGGLLNTIGKPTEAESAFRAAVALSEKLIANYPDVPGYRHSLAGTQISLGNLLGGLGRVTEAEAALRGAVTGFGKLTADFPAAPEYRRGLAISQLELGSALAALGKPTEAEAVYRSAIAVQEKLCADFPAVLDYALGLGGSYCNLARVADTTGGATAALEWYTKTVSCLAPVVAAEPRLVAARECLRNGHWGRARSLMQLERFGDALTDWDAALRLDDGSARLDLRAARGSCLVRLGRASEAAGAANEIVRDPAATAGQLYDCACVYSLASSVPGNPAAAAQGAEAVLLLRRTVAGPSGDVPHLLADRDLAPLRDRADYAALLWDLADSVDGK